jgi:acetoin utilization deacetylase AcuC-like enzyme
MLWLYDAGYDYGGGLPDSPRDMHGFLLRKPSEIRDALIRAGVVLPSAFHAPQIIAEEELLQVHDEIVIAGLHDAATVAQVIEVPEIAFLPHEFVWRAVVAPQLRATGGTCEALHAAAHGEWAINLSGGFHHAHRNLSHGFCLVNDVALGIARLRRAGIHRRVLIFDLDLHQGDGNATMFADDPEVYTVSLHEEAIFPFPKAHSDLDIGLPSYVDDDTYLAYVKEALIHVDHHFRPELIIYLAGSDPYKDDPFGSLQLTESGLVARDKLVGEFARKRGCPLVALPAGGYSDKSPAITAAGFHVLTTIEHK